MYSATKNYPTSYSFSSISYSSLLIISLIVFSSCEQSSTQPQNLRKGDIQGTIQPYTGGKSISTADVDGVLNLACGSNYNNLGGNEKIYSASAHALFVDKSYYDTILTTVSVSMNQTALENGYNSGLLSEFVPEPAQSPNSINWVVTNLNSQPITISDSPLQRLEFVNSVIDGDTLSLSGFSLNYTADSSITQIEVTLMFNTGASRYLLGDTSTSYPATISKKIRNTGTLSFSAAELASLRRGYYGISLRYFRLDEYNGSGRRILLAKSYSTGISAVLQ